MSKKLLPLLFVAVLALAAFVPAAQAQPLAGQPAGWPAGVNPERVSQGTDGKVAAVITPPLPDLPGALRGQGVTDMTKQLVEERTVDGRTWSIYSAPRVTAGIEQAFQIAVATDETATYAITAVSRAFLADAMREAVLVPAIEAFVPKAASN